MRSNNNPRPHPPLTKMEKTHIDGGNFRTAFLLILVVGVSVLFLAVIWPFLQALLFGAILAGLAQPLFHFLLRFFRGRAATSIATLLVMFVIIVGPVSALLSMVVQQAMQVGEHVTPWIQQQAGTAGHFDAHNWLVSHVPSLAEFIPSRQELEGHIESGTKALTAFVATGASSFTKGTMGFLLNTFVMIYAMFFFLKDGRHILETIFYYIPMNHQDEMMLLERFTSITKATIKGTLLISLIQGTLGGIAFYFAGIGGAIFWGAIMVVLSVLPGIGAALVWIPAVIYLFVSGQTLAGTLLAAWCAGVVGTIDNVLRPRLVGQDAQMPDLMILIGTLGGIYFFGPLGFIVGPVICGLFLTVWEIYGVAFREILPPVKKIEQPPA